MQDGTTSLFVFVILLFKVVFFVDLETINIFRILEEAIIKRTQLKMFLYFLL